MTNKIVNKDILLSNVIYANSNNISKVKCPFCGSENVKEDDVHLATFKTKDGSNITKKMFICQDCESAFSIPIVDENFKENLNKPEEWNKERAIRDTKDLFDQINRMLANPVNIAFSNLETFVKSEDSLVCLVLFKDGTVHYLTYDTTLRNIKAKIDNKLEVLAIVKFTKTGIVLMRDIMNPKVTEKIRFSNLAQLIRDNIINQKPTDTKKKKK